MPAVWRASGDGEEQGGKQIITLNICSAALREAIWAIVGVQGGNLLAALVQPQAFDNEQRSGGNWNDCWAGKLLHQTLAR